MHVVGWWSCGQNCRLWWCSPLACVQSVAIPLCADAMEMLKMLDYEVHFIEPRYAALHRACDMINPLMPSVCVDGACAATWFPSPGATLRANSQAAESAAATCLPTSNSSATSLTCANGSCNCSVRPSHWMRRTHRHCSKPHAFVRSNLPMLTPACHDPVFPCSVIHAACTRVLTCLGACMCFVFGFALLCSDGGAKCGWHCLRCSGLRRHPACVDEGSWRRGVHCHSRSC